MAKKKVKVKSGQLIDLLVLLLGIAAVCMMFLTCVKFNGTYLGSKSEIVGTEIIFGGEESVFGFSFMAMLPYLLAAISVVLVVLNLFGVCDLEIVAFAAFVVAAVFFFLAPQFVVIADSNVDKVIRLAGTFSLGTGSILAGVFAALSGLALLAKKFVK